MKHRAPRTPIGVREAAVSVISRARRISHSEPRHDPRHAAGARRRRRRGRHAATDAGRSWAELRRSWAELRGSQAAAPDGAPLAKSAFRRAAVQPDNPEAGPQRPGTHPQPASTPRLASAPQRAAAVGITLGLVAAATLGAGPIIAGGPTTTAPEALASPNVSATPQAAKTAIGAAQQEQERAVALSTRLSRATRPTPPPKATTPPPKATTAAPKAATPAWVHPMPRGRLSSCYGQRWGVLHAGMDLAAPSGTPVRAVGTGRVVSAGWSYSGYGISVMVKHKSGVLTHYAHLSRVSVRVGQRVAAGQTIGREGSTGDSTGPHLHFEVHKGIWRQVDPASWLRARGVKTGC